MQKIFLVLKIMKDMKIIQKILMSYLIKLYLIIKEKVLKRIKEIKIMIVTLI